MFLVIDQVPAVPDVLWGQLYRTKRSLHKLIELSDYRILKDAVWSNEKNLSVFIFELEQQVLPNVKKHLGPPLEREPECESFLAKYADGEQVVSGPSSRTDVGWCCCRAKQPTSWRCLRRSLQEEAKTLASQT